MAAKLPDHEAQRRLEALESTKRPGRPSGCVTEAARKLGGISPSALSRWLLQRDKGTTVEPLYTKAECIAELRRVTAELGKIPSRDRFVELSNVKSRWRTHWVTMEEFVRDASIESVVMQRVDVGDLKEKALRLLRSGVSLEVMAERLHTTRGAALDLCDTLRAEGFNVFERGDRYTLEAVPEQVKFDENVHLLVSDERGRHRIGVVSDNHLGSKYAREDVLHDLYDWFAAEGVTRVYNAGNWIDGEASFNKHDLLVHGMDNQLRYFAQRYPQREGISTYYVAGDDHEGWYAKDKGIDIGLRAQQTARELGRTDLHYLGYMEAFITLRHAKTQATAQMMVVHPGGGSAYAISYAPQKFVESLQGGEKPAVVIFGHWHKQDCFNYRNVWIYQAGTTEDQTPFMRKKKLEAHVGGAILELEQDERGAVVRCKPDMKRYFDRGYHNGQFNMAGDISRARQIA